MGPVTPRSGRASLYGAAPTDLQVRLLADGGQAGLKQGRRRFGAADAGLRGQLIEHGQGGGIKAGGHRLALHATEPQLIDQLVNRCGSSHGASVQRFACKLWTAFTSPAAAEAYQRGGC